MNLNFQKLIAWVLLLTGIFIIFWTIHSSYNVFTAKTPVPQILKTEEKEILKTKEKTPASLEEFQKEVDKAIQEQLKNLIPAKTLTTFLNLIVWSVFCGILIIAGGQISTLGIKLMKK